MTPTRRFRLHLRHRVFDGWIEPGGQAVAVDDPEYGLTTSAPTVEDLLRGYGGGHIQWPDEQHHEPPEQHEGEPGDRDPDH